MTVEMFWRNSAVMRYAAGSMDSLMRNSASWPARLVGYRRLKAHP
jgi:hypothetical protein